MITSHTSIPNGMGEGSNQVNLNWPSDQLNSEHPVDEENRKNKQITGPRN
jgi:hypothetical protein